MACSARKTRNFADVMFSMWKVPWAIPMDLRIEDHFSLSAIRFISYGSDKYYWGIQEPLRRNPNVQRYKFHLRAKVAQRYPSHIECEMPSFHFLIVNVNQRNIPGICWNLLLLNLISVWDCHQTFLCQEGNQLNFSHWIPIILFRIERKNGVPFIWECFGGILEWTSLAC